MALVHMDIKNILSCVIVILTLTLGCRPVDIYDSVEFEFTLNDSSKAIEIIKSNISHLTKSYSPHKIREECEVRDFNKYSKIVVCKIVNKIYIIGLLNPGRLDENRKKFIDFNFKFKNEFKIQKIKYFYKYQINVEKSILDKIL